MRLLDFFPFLKDPSELWRDETFSDVSGDAPCDMGQIFAHDGGAYIDIIDEQDPKVRVLEHRILANPPGRKELRNDFPEPVGRGGMKEEWTADLMAKVLKQFDADGIEDIKGETIYIAYPHKNPQIFPNHEDWSPYNVYDALEEQYPEIDWRLATGLVENRHLDRSGNQTSVHALIARQEYTFTGEVRDNPFNAHQNPNFILADRMMEQGTTIANFANFIEYNGGKIVGVSASKYPFKQERESRDGHEEKLSGVFADPARNTAQLEELAQAFAKSRGGFFSTTRHVTQKCMEEFEQAMNAIGHSVFALTYGECRRLVQTMENEHGYGGLSMNFDWLLDTLREEARKREAQPKKSVPNNDYRNLIFDSTGQLSIVMLPA